MHRYRTIDAYRLSIGGNRALHRRDGRLAAGDSAKAARAILYAIDAADAPLRLPLGQDAIEAIRAHHETLLHDLTRWEPVSVRHRGR
jgi:hypothetical protein